MSARFSWEVEVTVSTPFSELTASSMGFVMLVSTSEALAPGYTTEMATTGKETFGSKSTGRLVKLNNPTTTNANMIIVMNTGLLMDILGMFIETPFQNFSVLMQRVGSRAVAYGAAWNSTVALKPG